MILTLILPSEAEADIEAETVDGKKVKLKSLTISPRFWRPNASPSILFFENHAGAHADEAEGQLIQRGALQVSGQNGRLSVVDRTNPTMSKAEKVLQELAQDADEEGEAEEPDEAKRGKNVR